MEPFEWDRDRLTLRISEWERAVPGLVCGFTTRLGGLSAAPFDSMNCAMHVGDRDQAVIANRELLTQKLQFSIEQWTCAEQVHGNDVVVVTSTQRGKGNKALADAIPSADGLITGDSDVLLASFYADCVPLFFIAPSQRVVGIAHAGWKGTAGNIGARMVEHFAQSFQIEPKEIRVAIGPSIGGCCYEVDGKVVEAIGVQLPKETEPTYTKMKENGKIQLDLKEANRVLLERAGIHSILMSRLCSSCRNDLFYSYRKEAGRTGRMTAFIGFN
ncbi:hypothetical protein BEP19_06805 [Ammoniphilus oxalaticus]|uniref:Purine nucleoside phosphorylase n=1 Tax=Ammoniphilus oxalaticus TaxID=66863 RepID=A0A419SJH7_9BACL|nr:peptidoglycan editing factor PgeF [Ammoniphilus oxalaticus]RKD24112.1 hypothetical protein BEP19_06805 [Ammoniphilus oxalaticus]